MGIISWLIVGAIAGYVVGSFLNSTTPLGVVGHITLGMVGALVGGFLAGLVVGGDPLTGLNIATITVALIGAVVAVWAWYRIRGTATTGGGAG